MKIVIDTNSLLALVRYYLPFDREGILFDFIKEKIYAHEIIIIDKVLLECQYVSKGIIMKQLLFLSDREFLKSAGIPIKTDSLLIPASKDFLHKVNSVFVNSVVRKAKRISDVEFENQKNSFLKGADMSQVIYCLNIKRLNEEVMLVTEETENPNDNKLFKKIPAICKYIDISTLSLPEMIKESEEIKLDFKLN